MDCHYIPEIIYDNFSNCIHDKAISKGIPIAGSIELTFRCNLKCAHCYVSYDHRKNELTYQEICDIIDQITHEGCLWLLITGGEPLIRDDFLEIYTYAKKKGLLITLFSNGTLMTPQIADYFQKCCPFLVEITLYGATKKTYEKVTGVPGSFERCMDGIHLLLERKVPLNLKTMVMTINRHEIWKMKEYAGRLGVEFRFDSLINPMLDGSRKPCRLRLSPKEVVKLDLNDEKKIKSWRQSYERGGPAHTDNLYNCYAGQTIYNINPYGQLSMCIMSRLPNYDLRHGSFQVGWNDHLHKIRAQKASLDYKCGRCELSSICDQCPGWALLENGDQETSVEYLCQIAHLKAKVLGLD